MKGQHEKIRIGFFGYGTRALDALMEHPDFDVKYFWSPQSRLCDEVYEAAERYQGQLELENIKNRKDLLKHVEGATDVSCFLMNASPIILNEPILEQMDFYNIHPGNLANNRGHHPHLWSILLDEKETQINLHAVTPEIDLGKVIASVPVPVLPDDTSLTLLNRAEDQVGQLLTDLACYLRGEQKEIDVITQGGYRQSVTYEDYHICQETDTVEDMSRKIRARVMHSGGFFEQEEKRYYVNSIVDCRGDIEEAPTARIQDSEGYLILHRGKERIRFRESKITDQEGNVLWKRRREEEEG